MSDIKTESNTQMVTTEQKDMRDEEQYLKINEEDSIDDMDLYHVEAVFSDREKSGKKALVKLIIVAVICLLFMAAEVVGGFISGSLAVLSDAAHMFTDFAGLALAIVSLLIGKRPATKTLTYGYARAEVIGALASMMLIWGITIWLVYEAAERVVSHDEVDGKLMFITAIFGLVCNLVMMKVLHSGHDHDHGHGHSHSHGHDHEHRSDHRHKHKDSKKSNHNHKNKKRTHDHQEDVKDKKTQAQNHHHNQYLIEIKTKVEEKRQCEQDDPTTPEIRIGNLNHKDHQHYSEDNRQQQPKSGPIGSENAIIDLELPNIIATGSYCHDSKSNNKKEGDNHAHHHNHNHKHSQCGNGQKKKKKSHSHSHSHSNLNVQSAFLHVLGDTLQSVGVTIAGALIWINPEWRIADPICTFLFSALVLLTTVKISKNCVRTLMEGAPPGVNVEEYEKELLALPEVINVHDLHVWSLSSGKIAMTAHLTSSNPPRTLKKATSYARKHGIYHSTFQVESFVEDSADHLVFCAHDLHN